MVDMIVIAALVLMAGAAVFYVLRAKKKGTKCIGCSCCKGGNDCRCNHQK